jgi:hypothetical protein
MHADSRPDAGETSRRDEPERGAALSRAEANFAAAQELCRTGHGSDGGAMCTYGGLAAANGYWLASESCELNHGETCDLRAVCDGAAAETGFHGREGMALVDDWIWRVCACQPCADLYVAAHPKWTRKPPGPPVSHEETMRRVVEIAEAVLADMTPQQRAVSDMMTNLLLYGQHPAPETPPTFRGLLGFDDPIPFSRAPTMRNAPDRYRIRFLRETEKLVTSPGVSAGDLEAARSAILALAESPGPQPTDTCGPATGTAQ